VILVVNTSAMLASEMAHYCVLIDVKQTINLCPTVILMLMTANQQFVIVIINDMDLTSVRILFYTRLVTGKKLAVLKLLFLVSPRRGESLHQLESNLAWL